MSIMWNSDREILVSFLNRLGLPQLVMYSRPLVRSYFERKYRNEDPYLVATSQLGKRYGEMVAVLAGRRFRKCLDIGCGEGLFSAMMLTVCDQVTGIDISATAVARAQARNATEKSIRFAVVDVAQEDIGSGYDLIVCAELLYYLNQKQLSDVVSKLYLSLGDSGYILLGNIKRISPGAGLFRGHFAAAEIHRRFKDSGRFIVVREVDRGHDVLLLLQKRPT